MRRCLKCRCLFAGSRCACRDCSSRTARGYGTAHQAARQALAATLPAPCGYCGKLIGAGARWHAAHAVDGHAEHGNMVAHPACYERAKVR